MKAKKLKGQTRLKEIMGWKPAHQASKEVAARPNAMPIKPLKPIKKPKLLRFRQFIGMKQSLREATATEVDIAAASLIVINKDRTSAELKDALDGFVKDCNTMSSDGHTVIAMAVAVD
jgi:hypothetical protein